MSGKGIAGDIALEGLKGLLRSMGTATSLAIDSDTIGNAKKLAQECTRDEIDAAVDEVIDPKLRFVFPAQAVQNKATSQIAAEYLKSILTPEKS
jgi:hypothetical protein